MHSSDNFTCCVACVYVLFIAIGILWTHAGVWVEAFIRSMLKIFVPQGKHADNFTPLSLSLVLSHTGSPIHTFRVNLGWCTWNVTKGVCVCLLMIMFCSPLLHSRMFPPALVQLICYHSFRRCRMQRFEARSHPMTRFQQRSATSWGRIRRERCSLTVFLSANQWGSSV